VRQSEELRENLKQNLPSEQDVGLIVVSPMKRTLQTALIALDWLIDKGVHIHANADWQGRPI
jgi:broad specificity phosphatase PhoE